MSPAIEVAHPLIQHHLASLRDSDTTPPDFRHQIHRLAALLAYEATQDLVTTDVQVTTPLTTTTCQQLTQRIGLIPILRAGLGMVDPILDLIPSAEVWHLGLYRDEETAQPVSYYSKLPKSEPVDVALVIDPMLATGGSACSALQVLAEWGVPRTKLLSVIAAPEGIAEVQNQFPDTPILVCSIDECLNDQKFIVPGLGDAGDRIFNTQRNH